MPPAPTQPQGPGAPDLRGATLAGDGLVLVSLLLSITMMTFGTLAVACMPTFAQIGVMAPLLVILARLVQGFSAGAGKLPARA